MATAQEIWTTLSKIDVSAHTEEKGHLTYLSWAWAWGILKDNYPEAHYKFKTFKRADGTEADVMTYEDETCSVHCIVEIGAEYEEMWLPVMDYKNNAIQNPDARAISDSKMRCLTKCIGVFGLGHYIYAGEDLPREPDTTKKPAKQAKKKETTKVSNKKTEDDGWTTKGQKPLTVTYQVFADGCTNLTELRDFWTSNKQELSLMETENPDLYAEVLQIFSNKKAQLTKEVVNG